MIPLHRGDIVLVNFGNHNGNSLQEGIRPAVVIQNNLQNDSAPTTIVAPLTSVIKKADATYHVVLGKRFNLRKNSMLLTEQIKTISQTSIKGIIGYIDDPAVLTSIDRSLIKTLGISISKEVST